ncbi:MAG TPA: tetratricopeptide repeat-containing sensor histidine kinase [Flavipsychrobacter sp.]|jgi:signal transduction histidine kinase|nr:tetratricopeptide repeat-containing sensor histidine kinase [Flavipsychrobacter sp.]
MRYVFTLLLGLVCLSFYNASATDFHEDTASINRIVNNIDRLIAKNRDSALQLATNAYKLAQKIGYQQGIADAGQLLGTYETHQSHYEKALSYYQESINYYKKEGQLKNLASVYSMMGINEAMQNSPAKALHWFLLAKDVLYRMNDKHGMADINYKIGLVYGDVNDYEHAVGYQNQSLKYAEQTGDTSLSINVYNNLGVLYGENKQYEKALAVLQKAAFLSGVINKQGIDPFIFHNLGNVYLHLSDLDSAQYFLNASLALYQKAEFPVGIGGVSTSLADLFIHQKKYDEALGYINQSMAIATVTDDKEQLYQNYLLLQQVYVGQGKYKEAALLFDTTMALSKQVENAEKRALVEKTSMEQEIKDMSDSVIALQKDNGRKTHQRNVFILISILTLLIVVVVVVAAVQIRKKNKLLQDQKEALENLNEVKDKLFAVISHDLRSPLGSIISSMELLESEVLNQQDQRALIGELHLSASATLETLDNLLVWGAGQFQKENLHREAVDVKLLADKINRLLVNVASHKNIELVQKVDELCIARFDKNQLEFIMRNLVANAIKFSKEGEKIEIRGYRQNGHVVFEVEDNGVGMSEETIKKLFDIEARISSRGTSGERGVGLGLILIQEFLSKNQGHIAVESEEGKGSCFKVNIPAV